MKHSEIQSLALLYGKKELIEQFLDIFYMDRAHDGAPLNAVLVQGNMKKDIKNLRIFESLRNPKGFQRELKKFVWKGD